MITRGRIVMFGSVVAAIGCIYQVTNQQSVEKAVSETLAWQGKDQRSACCLWHSDVSFPDSQRLLCVFAVRVCFCAQRMHRAVQVDKQRLAERERERAELGLVDGGLVPSAGAAGSGSSNSSNKAQR